MPRFPFRLLVRRKEKRGSLYLSLIPLSEALALPIKGRMSNAETHAEYALCLIAKHNVCTYTYPTLGTYRCLILDL